MASHINADLCEDKNDLICLCDDIDEVIELMGKVGIRQARLSALLERGPEVLAKCKEILGELIEEVE